MITRRGCVTVILLAATLGAARGCRTPTEVTVTIKTNAPCTAVRSVDITVGPDPETTEARVGNFVSTSTRACSDDGTIGTLVVTPGGSTADIVVTVQLGALACKPSKPSSLDPSYKDCIVARRNFSFVDHVALDIPIELDVDCANVPCDAISSCDNGRCVDAKVVCADDGCTFAGADGGADGGGADVGPMTTTDAGDATIIDDAPIGSSDGAVDDSPSDAVADTAMQLNGADGGTSTCMAIPAAQRACNGPTLCGPSEFCCRPLLTHVSSVAQCLPLGTSCDGFAECCEDNTNCLGGICCIPGVNFGSPTNAQCLTTVKDCAMAAGAEFCGDVQSVSCTMCVPSQWNGVQYCK